MFLSIWRFSHLALALSTLLFVLTLSITGAILAFEPIAHAARNLESADKFPERTLGQVIAAVQSEYHEPVSIRVDAQGYLSVSAMTQSGDFVEHYIHPVTAEYAGEIPVQSRWMKNVTTLHRSLFFKTPGRVIVAVTSFLFFLMAVSGIVLVAKRQQGVRNFFRKVIPDGASSFLHVHLGRLLVVPLILIALSGVYLSLLRFDIIPGFFAAHAVNPEAVSDTPALDLSDFPGFNHTSISEVRAVDFPFSKDPQDFYILKLRTKEVWVNQFTGKVESEVDFPLLIAFSEAATLIHTGRGSAWWSAVLALASLSVPIFAITGLRMTRKRRAARINNRWGKGESPCYILVATETGTTMQFARDFQNRLAEAGTKSYLDHMNAFAPYPQMKTLVVFAATYGKGEPPANAGKFEDKLRRASLPSPFTYAVVGFGSRAYPDFCKFALDVDDMLSKLPKSTGIMEVFPINSRSHEAYRLWLRRWGRRMDIPLTDSHNLPTARVQSRREEFVTEEGPVLGDTRLLVLKPKKPNGMVSGDLIAIQPEEGTHERLYSAGVMKDGRVLLSVKRHAWGLCSQYLCQMDLGETLRGRVVKNRKFRFPNRAPEVVMIATGTGVAPFLGMLDRNKGRTPTRLYWGGKTTASLDLYKPILQTLLDQGKLSLFSPAFSREDGEVKYVQDLIVRDATTIAGILKRDGVILICGSVAMQKGVTDVLDEIVRNLNGHPLSRYQNKNRIRMDCY